MSWRNWAPHFVCKISTYFIEFNFKFGLLNLTQPFSRYFRRLSGARWCRTLSYMKLNLRPESRRPLLPFPQLCPIFHWRTDKLLWRTRWYLGQWTSLSPRSLMRGCDLLFWSENRIWIWFLNEIDNLGCVLLINLTYSVSQLSGRTTLISIFKKSR